MFAARAAAMDMAEPGVTEGLDATFALGGAKDLM